MTDKEIAEVLQTREQKFPFTRTTYLKPPDAYHLPSSHRFAELRGQKKHIKRPQDETTHHAIPSALISAPLDLNSPTPSKPSNLVIHPAAMVKPRKARPAPLELNSNDSRIHRSVSPAATSPYPESIISLYSATPSNSPNSLNHSLPVYTFQASDLPSPGHSASTVFSMTPVSSSSSVFSTSSSKSSSPRTSCSSISARTSLSSLHQEFQCQMPTAPSPVVIFSAKKSRVYSPPLPNGRRELRYHRQIM